MKRLFVIVLMMVFIVSGCTTREYDSNMELGKSQLKEENYLEAHEAFEVAYKDDQTAEAKELMELSGLLANGMEKYEIQDFDAAQVIFEEAAAYKSKFEEGKLMIQKAKEMSAEAGEASVEPEEDIEIQEQPSQEQPPVEEPVEGVTESEAEDEPVIETEEPVEEETVIEEPADTETEESKKEDSDKTLTKAQGEQLVKDYVDIENYPQLQIQYDHDDEKGDYIYQVFEVVNDSEEGGHTATWGWYGVNNKTKEVYEVM